MAGSLRRPLLLTYLGGAVAVAVLVALGSLIGDPPRASGDACSGRDLTLDVVADDTSYSADRTVVLVATLRWAGAVPCSLAPVQRATHWSVQRRGNDGGTVWEAFCDPSPLGHPQRPKTCRLDPGTPTIAAGGALVLSHTWSQQPDGRPADDPGRAAPGQYLVDLQVAGEEATGYFALTG